MEEGSRAEQPAAMASEDRISELPTELMLPQSLDGDAPQFDGKDSLRDPRVGMEDLKRRVALEPDLQRALSVAGAEKGRFSRGAIDGPMCSPSDPTATGKGAVCESKRRRMEAGVSAIRELTADAAVAEGLPPSPMDPTHGKPVPPPPAMNGHCHPEPSLNGSPRMPAFFSPRPLETPSPIPSEMSVSPSVPATSGKRGTQNGKFQPGDGLKVEVGDFVRVRASQRDIDVIMKSEEKLWADIGRQACHGWLSRRRAAVKRTGPMLGRVTAIEYEDDGRVMVCMSRLYREEETVCGRSKHTGGGEGEKLALVVRVLQKGAAALAVACVRVPGAYVERVQVQLCPDPAVDPDDDPSLKSAEDDMPSLPPVPTLSSVYLPELDISIPLCPLSVRWEAPFDALTVLLPHPTGGGRVALWSGGAVCHGCRTLREQVAMWSCRGCGHLWCPSCTDSQASSRPSLETSMDQTLVGGGRKDRQFLGPCCKGTCACLRCAYASNRQAFLGSQSHSPTDASSIQGGIQVARCSKCSLTTPCSSMVRCACCAGQWAHRDCVAYAMGQADRDAKDAAGLTSALGHLGKRVRRGAKHGGALVRVDAYCPRKSHFLLCNEDTGVMSWAPLSNKAAVTPDSEALEARPWTCDGCVDRAGKAAKGKEGGGKLWSEKVIWGLAEKKEPEDGLRTPKLVVLMDDSTLPSASSSSNSLSADSLPPSTPTQAAAPPAPSSPSLPSKLPTPPASGAGHTMDEAPSAPRPPPPLDPSPLSPTPSLASPSLASQSPPLAKPSDPPCRGWKRRRLEDKGLGGRMVGLLLDQLLGPSQAHQKGGKSGPLSGPAVFALPPSLLREVPTRGLRWHADVHQEEEDDDEDSDLPRLTPSLVTFFRGPRLLTDGIPFAELGEYASGSLTLGEHEMGVDHAGRPPRQPTPTPSLRSTQVSRPPSTHTVESLRPGSAASSVVTANHRIMSPPLLLPHADEAADSKPVASKKAPPPPEVEDKEECARTRAFKPKVRTRGHGGRLSKAATAQAAPDSATEGRAAGSKGGGGKKGQSQAPASKEIIGKERAQRLGQRHMRKQFEGIPSELLKVDDFKARQKAVRFGKSKIHRWGVFAAEALRKDDMLLEYRGEAIGNAVAEIREKLYDRLSIGSDYMFRVDENTVIDATRRGSLARYVNHSCDPNCYTAIIPSDGKKKILLYAKRPIEVGEELCYDYKFPIDPDNKVACHCGAKKCRKFMN